MKFKTKAEINQRFSNLYNKNPKFKHEVIETIIKPYVDRFKEPRIQFDDYDEELSKNEYELSKIEKYINYKENTVTGKFTERTEEEKEKLRKEKEEKIKEIEEKIKEIKEKRRKEKEEKLRKDEEKRKKDYDVYEKENGSNIQKIIDDLYNKLYKNIYGELTYMLSDILNPEYDSLEDQTIDQFVERFIIDRNEKIFGDIIQWNESDSTKRVYTDYHNFKRTLYSDIHWTIINMEMNAIEKDGETKSVYSGIGEFKWWNNEYTIYANGRDVEKDEKLNNLDDQMSKIADKVYNTHKGMNDIGKPAEIIWTGKIVGKDVAIDLAIRWDRNVWQSTAHLPEQGKFRGRLVYHADVYAAVFESTMTAINTVNDMQSKLGKFGGKFFGKNKTSFMDKMIDKAQDKAQDKYFDQFEKDD